MVSPVVLVPIHPDSQSAMSIIVDEEDDVLAETPSVPTDVVISVEFFSVVPSSDVTSVETLVVEDELNEQAQMLNESATASPEVSMRLVFDERMGDPFTSTPIAAL